MKFMLSGKIHRARVTECDLTYEGSCAVDTELLAAADILPNEKVHIYNITNGQRFETYAIEAPAGSKTIGLNGAAARLGTKGDIIIIVSYSLVKPADLLKHKPKIVLLNENNDIKEKN
ncbi:MAG: aspartate 1-decarboxylase [Candidatus Muiribacteriota bacterium]